MSIGKKYDKGKSQWHLLPLRVLDEVVHVLMYGAKRYGADNWKLVQPKERYFDACIRHLSKYQAGERNDVETGRSHLAHAACCLLFLIWNEQNRKENVKRATS